MKKMLIILFVSVMMGMSAVTVYAGQGGGMDNILENIPYQEKGMGRRKLVDEKYMLMMQAALRPGQSVPQHNANSNVNIIVLKGEVVVNLDGVDNVAKEGALLPVADKTPMNIENRSRENATFLIIKTPKPKQ